jgi:hypothetical protein
MLETEVVVGMLLDDRAGGETHQADGLQRTHEVKLPK